MGDLSPAVQGWWGVIVDRAMPSMTPRALSNLSSLCFGSPWGDLSPAMQDGGGVIVDGATP